MFKMHTAHPAGFRSLAAGPAGKFYFATNGRGIVTGQIQPLPDKKLGGLLD